MLNFLFWNVNGKPLTDLIVQLTEEHRIDVLIIAECEIEARLLLLRLNDAVADGFHYPFSLCPRISMFTRFSADFIRPIFEEKRVSIRRLQLPGRPEILVAAVHLPSKRFWSGESQSAECAWLSANIRQAERDVGHERTLLVGDLNMNPFESGMISAHGLHAVMSRRIAAKLSRLVRGRRYPFFYNPMWSHLGDLDHSVSGTHYYERSEHVNYFWNMFDQVLIRPSVADCLPPEHVRIIVDIGGRTLLSEEGRLHQKASDHLPILFTLNL